MAAISIRQQQVGLLLLLLLISGAELTSGKSQPVCSSVECTILSSQMISMMNQSVDPCEDFYSYACGNFPSTVSYSPCKVDRYQTVGTYLFEDSMSVMTEKVGKKVYELLVLDSVDSESDPDIRDLNNLTRQFFLGCTSWVSSSGSEFQYQDVSATFLKDMLNHLMQKIQPAVGLEMKLEEILAEMIRAGGSGYVKVELPPGFTYDFLDEPLLDVTNISATYLDVSERKWTAIVSKDYIEFLQKAGLVTHLDMDNWNSTFGRINSELYENDFYRIRNRIKAECFSDTTQTYYSVKMTVAELDAMSQCASQNSSFSWKLFFESILQSSVDDNTLINVNDPPRLIAIMKYFKEQPVYTSDGRRFSGHVSYLIFDWIMGFGGFLPSGLRNKWNMALRYSYSTPRRPDTDRVKDCMMLTKKYMQPVLERMYRNVYHPKGFKEVLDFVHLVKRSSINSVRRQSWIQRESKDAIVEKIRWIQHSIGLAELTSQQIKDFYNATLEMFRATVLDMSNPENNFGKLMAILLCANARRNFEIMTGRSPVSVFMVTNPLEVNAYNFLESNRIVFPMAILEPPVYHPSYPDYIKMGNLGYTIGHEIGHAFDDYGHELNRLGALGHFWDNKTEENFLKRSECVRQCYGNYTLYPGGPRYNSNTTLGNDISDIIGLKAAFDALQILKRNNRRVMQKLPHLEELLNEDQLFFVQAAQGYCAKAEKQALEEIFGGPYASHSANHLRVTGMMQNSLEFARTFKCKRGQAMHPERKCTFW